MIYLLVGGSFLLVSYGLLWFNREILKDLPQIEKIYTPPSLSSKIKDRNGRLLYVFYRDEQRTWVSLDKIPRSLVLATLAIEDKDFYTHLGLSIKGIARAMWFNLTNRNEEVQGGSTITQQLVKNVFLSQEKSWKRKIKEMLLAIILESRLTKDEILERYFNQVPYGGEVYGAQEAAKKYFGKEVWDLTLFESTFLAGLPAAPSSYSPQNFPEIALKRQRRVVEEMVKAGFISKETAEGILKIPVVLKNEKINILAPHFVFYVKDRLENDFGFSNLSRAGITVTTSLDYDLQRKSEDIVWQEIAKVKNLRIRNGAMLITDVTSGEVLVMVGSKDYYALDVDGKVNITTALRQPGSAIKPINYLLALMRGASLSDWIDDAPVTYRIPGQKNYTPQNYNGKYMGRVTLKTALASSLNIPSVKLLESNGVKNMIDLAETMGITTWKDRSRFGLSLALGAGEVKMVDMAQAYSNFANLGNKIKINPIIEIEDYRGENIYTKRVEPQRIFTPELAYLIDMALSDDMARAPIFGTGSKLFIPGKTVAVKTGTTNNLKDNWAIGWTPKYLVAAWVGNNDATPMSWVASGISGATPIWNRGMHLMIDKTEDVPFAVPTGVIKEKVCGKEEWFLAGTEKKIACPTMAKPSPTLMP